MSNIKNKLLIDQELADQEYSEWIDEQRVFDERSNDLMEMALKFATKNSKAFLDYLEKYHPGLYEWYVKSILH
jgi:hypothetical protein